MSNEEYTPPKVWTWEEKDGGKFGSTNRPVAGATHDKILPVGKHPLQLHSLATPNGVKVTVMLEELLAAGHKGAEYDAYLINIMEGDQFGSGFVEINPNSKIPALIDMSTETPTRVFESYKYAPISIEYCIDRFTMETKRQLDVLDRQLADKKFIIGDDYTIADIAIWPWYGALVLGRLYDAAEFLDVASYKNVVRWAEEINARPAVKRGCIVNRIWGDEDKQMPERHSPNDFKKQNT